MCDAKNECGGFFLDRTDPENPACGNWYGQSGLNKFKLGPKDNGLQGDCYEKTNCTEHSPPHGLALKLSPQNPSASPVLEVAPLSPIGIFLCKISP